MELVVVPWTPCPVIRIAAGSGGNDVRRRSGVPIDVSDPDVAALVDAYEALWAAVPLDEAAITVAHTAVLETASLLRCAAPAGPAELEYVRRRRRAIAAPLIAAPLIAAPRTADDPIAYLASL